MRVCPITLGTPRFQQQVAELLGRRTGAAQAVVEQAGGRVETLAGQPLRHAKPQEHLNPYFVVWGNAS
ncbi:hypothetical protein [Halomonas daqiaonensis]|uniref:3'(2'), 5'-bisphosphate nucleotidase n=1 Tax=Halomonas daqiaonensis TaxID=650850 RepID=A0A1H7VP77_9GAMM|nr:3'(2'), 5'-bisphosphate nucleotidase [Halomonas daqiaonensis]